MVVVIWAVRGWAHAHGSSSASNASSAAAKAMQAYVGIHLCLLYLVQLPFFGSLLPFADSLSDVLGLFHVSWDTGAADLVPQLLHLTCLHALYASMGSYARVAALRRAMGANASAACVSSGSAGLATAGTAGLYIVDASWVSQALPLLASSALHFADAASGPVVASVALLCSAMLEVSVAGGLLLALGIWALLAPRRLGKQALARMSPCLADLLLLWLFAVYVATGLQTYFDFIPQVSLLKLFIPALALHFMVLVSILISD